MRKRSSSRRSSKEAPFFPGMLTPKEAFRHIRNYLAGQHVGATRDDALLDEVLKCLFCKLYIESSTAPEIPANLDVMEKSKRVRQVFAKVRSDFPDIYDTDTEIMLDPNAVSMILSECDFSLFDAASDPIGDAFEVFVGSESRSRAGQFFTPRPVSDFLARALNPQPGETVIDPACGAGGFLTSVTRHFIAQGVPTNELEAITSKTIYGIDKDAYLVKLAKLHVALMTKGHPHAIFADSLALSNGESSIKKRLPKDGFDVLLTNPPFGVHIVAANPDVLRTFELAKKWKHDMHSNKWLPTNILQMQVPPQVLFVERCLSLLKEGGRLGMVLPESILSNKSYRHVMEFLFQHADIQAVIGMPESLFKTSGKGGTHTKTCLLIAQKQTQRQSAKVFMAEAKWCGHDSRARAIPHNDLPAISDNFELHKQHKRFEESALGFVLNKTEVRSNVLCPRYYDPQITIELKSLTETHTLVSFKELATDGVLSVTTGDELGKLAYGTGTIPFIRTSDISNWELKADPKHGVDRNLFETFKRKQDVRAGDILLVKDGTYLVGTCAIISEADTEIIYQSHLFKIRVNANRLGLDPYLLLAILSSPIVQRQVKAKQFTQDIIDSLGERLYELVIPIPKSPELRREVGEKVRKAVKLRIEARELSKEARARVHGCAVLDEV
ncbi:N-6 DNA methylase [Alloacidobacterium dinghuense]|uniref:N-6 DNA methylase n=1 Tax=Alloacidobacterium dinghuense TaxID=2763107 RepID=A0A7G8BE89_9BACT|nr:N-6 DNA methylase [Alloacidobacterium dinghuense]QNI30859.1 N-6 DNA methylase [Alloacidobacterium dinghuense]